MPAYRVQTVFNFGVCVACVCVPVCAAAARVCARVTGFRVVFAPKIVIQSRYDFASASHWLSESVVTLTADAGFTE